MITSLISLAIGAGGAVLINHDLIRTMRIGRRLRIALHMVSAASGAVAGYLFVQ